MRKHQILLFILMLVVFFWVGIFSKTIVPDWLLLQLGVAADLYGYLATCSALAIAVIAWLRRFEIQHWFQKRHFMNTGVPFEVQPEQVLAVVIPVSNPKLAEWILSCLKPKKVAFVYTEMSQNVALQLADSFTAAGFSFFPTAANIKNSEFMLADPDNPKESRELVKLLISHFLSENVPSCNIFVDTTGGKVPMSIGAFQAAEELNVSTIYIVATKNRIEDARDCTQGKPIFMSDHTLR